MPRRPLPQSCGARAGGWRGRPTTWRPGPSCPRTACPTCTPASRAPPTAPTSTSPRVRPPHTPGPPPPLPPPRKPRGSSTSTRRCSPTPPTTRNTDTGWRFDHWEAPAIPSSLRLYREVRDLGFKTFLLTGRSEAHKGVTVDNLRKQGYHEWDKLILRPRVRPCGAAKRGHSGGLPAAAEA